MSEPDVLRLPRQREAVSAARRFVADRLTANGLGDLVDDAVLAVSELVTNAVLYTTSDVLLDLKVRSDGVRVSVQDTSPILPTPNNPGSGRLSGRGLLLVEQLTQQWGVDRRDDDGKAVWFELVKGSGPTVRELTDDELLDLYDLPQPEGRAPSASPARILVCVPDVPSARMLATKNHTDDVVRDLTLVAGQPEAGSDTVPEELRLLARRAVGLCSQLSAFRSVLRTQALAASRNGRETFTIQVEVEPDMRHTLLAYRAALEEADQQCRDGRLLLTDCGGDVVEFRRWYLDQILAQLPAPADPARTGPAPLAS